MTRRYSWLQPKENSMYGGTNSSIDHSNTPPKTAGKITHIWGSRPPIRQ